MITASFFFGMVVFLFMVQMIFRKRNNYIIAYSVNREGVNNERRVPITVEEAVRKVMGFADKGLKELLPIELAYGRILAEDLVADHDVPSFNRSPYDGFAIRAEDTNLASYETPIVFEVVGEIGAAYRYR